MSHKTAATVAHTIGKNTLHLIGLDDQGTPAGCGQCRNWVNRVGSAMSAICPLYLQQLP